MIVVMMMMMLEQQLVLLQMPLEIRLLSETPFTLSAPERTLLEHGDGGDGGGGARMEE